MMGRVLLEIPHGDPDAVAVFFSRGVQDAAGCVQTGAIAIECRP